LGSEIGGDDIREDRSIIERKVVIEGFIKGRGVVEGRQRHLRSKVDPVGVCVMKDIGDGTKEGDCRVDKEDAVMVKESTQKERSWRPFISHMLLSIVDVPDVVALRGWSSRGPRGRTKPWQSA